MTTPAAAGRPFTGRHMLLIIVGFFGVVGSVNVGMAVLASTSWTGLVVTNSYVASQEFETKRLAHERQREAGWRTTFAYAGGIATVSVRDADGQVPALGPLTLKINRPVGGHDDQTLALEPTADGGFAAALDLSSGVWEARVTADETPLGPFELHTRFTVGTAK